MKPVGEAEVDQFESLLGAARSYYQQHSEDAQQLTTKHAVENVAVEEKAAWVATVRMILNMDEFIVRD